MRVEELMSAAKCCGENDTVRDCARMMKEEGIGFLPVCDQQRKPIGAITDRDLAIRVLADGRSPDERLSAFMTREVVACRVGDDVDHAEQLMRDHQMSRVMVCDEQGLLKGVISLADIADAESDESSGRTLQDVKSGEPDQAHH